MIRIAGVVVLYNPEIDILKNVSSYAGQIGHLYAIDNSENPDPEVIEKIKNIQNLTYIWNGKN